MPGNPFTASVADGSLSNEDRETALSRIRVFLLGAFMPASRMPDGIEVISINNSNDIVAVLGRNVPLKDLRFGSGTRDHCLEQYLKGDLERALEPDQIESTCDGDHSSASSTVNE